MYHSLALKIDGSVWSWGWNGLGKLGDGTTVDRDLPVRAGLDGVTAIATGAFHSLAVVGDGTIRAWGWNAYGQLGSGSTHDIGWPTEGAALRHGTVVAGGAAHTVAVSDLT